MPLKTETMTIREEPGVKRMLCYSAEWECRSIANMIEVMAEHAKKMGINDIQPKRKSHSKLK